MKNLFHSIIALSIAVVFQAASAGIDSGPAPDFTLKSNTDQNLRLAEQRGEVVMLNFWASWCGPCREEMPHLNNLSEEYEEMGFKLLGINVDENLKDANRAIKKFNVRFPVLFDAENDIAELYKVDSMPTTIIIDRNGEIRHLHRGYKRGYEEEYRKQVGALVFE